MKQHEKFIKVIISGGVHGNELTGPYLIRKWHESPQSFRRPSLQTQMILANTEALLIGRRYVEEDLNRCFSLKRLKGRGRSREMLLARQLNEALGPKGSLQEPDIIFDIHNSTANMGCTLIFGQISDTTKALYAELLLQEPRIRLYYMPEDRDVASYLPTIGKYDVCVEVGPQPHGTLQAELFFLTESVMTHALDLLEQINTSTFKHTTTEIPLYTHYKNIDFPRDEDRNISAMIHPERQGKDYQELKPGDPLFLDFQGNTLKWEENEVVYPVFINEHAYYEKGIAMSLTKKSIVEW